VKVILLSLLLLTVIGFAEIQAQESDIEIPSWVKAVAGYWSDNEINDKEFVEALEFLIDNRVINLGENVVVGMSENSLVEKEYEEKLEAQLKKHIGEKYKMMEEWRTLSNEYDQKLVDAEKKYDDMVERKGAEYHQAVQELEDKIRELKESNP